MAKNWQVFLSCVLLLKSVLLVSGFGGVIGVTFECDPGYATFTDGTTRSCVKAVMSEVTWLRARYYCKQDGADLLTIRNSKKMEFIQTLLNSSQYYEHSLWIGLNDRGNNATFVWLDEHNKTDFSHWSVEEPNNYTGQPHCTAMGGDHQRFWFVHPCDYITFDFVCEKPDSKTPTTQTTTSTITTSGQTTTTTTAAASTNRTTTQEAKTDGTGGLSTPHKVAIAAGGAVILCGIIILVAVVYKKRTGQFTMLKNSDRRGIISKEWTLSSVDGDDP